MWTPLAEQIRMVSDAVEAINNTYGEVNNIIKKKLATVIGKNHYLPY